METKKKRRKRGSGRVWLEGPVWWIQYYLHGKQVRESSGNSKKMVAEELLKKRLDEKNAGVLRITSAAKLRYERMRDSLYTKYRNDGKHSLRLLKDGTEYVSGVRPHLDDFFAGYRASDITTQEMRKFVDKRLKEGASKGCINGSLNILRSMFSTAFKDGLIVRNDIPYFPMFKQSGPRNVRLDPSQFEKLHAELPQYLKAPVRLAYYNGLRRAEVFGLKWTDIDWDAGIIRLSGKVTKTGKARMTPIPGPVMADLKALFVNRRPGAELIFEYNGRRVGDFKRSWRTALKRAGLPANFVFHGLRYCAASNLTSAGVSRIVAQGITGHETDSIFRRYNLVADDDLTAASDRVTAYVENGEKKGRMREAAAAEREAPLPLPI